MARISTRNDARNSFIGGVGAVARLVAPTYGPGGRAVLSSRSHQAPALLHLGYEIANEIEFDAPGFRAGASAMRQLAADVQQEIGSGTTLALLLGDALLGELSTCLDAGISGPALQETAFTHGAALIADLERASNPIADPAMLRDIAARAAGDFAIGEAVAAAHERAGAEGVLFVEARHGSRDETIVEKGMTFAQEWAGHPFLSQAGDDRISLSTLLILLHQGAIDSFAPMARVLEMMARSGKDLLVVADSFGSEAVATLMLNRDQAGAKIAPMKAAGAGPWRMLMLEDLAVRTGATIVGETLGSSLDGLRPDVLGRADNVEITRHSVSVVGGRGDEEQIRARCEGIRQSIETTRYLSFDREQHQRRLARFVAGVVRLSLGSRTSAELSARQGAAKSAAAALRCAAAGGVVPGGPAALMHAAARCEPCLPRNEVGRAVARAYARALRIPSVILADNVGADGGSIAYRIETSRETIGFDAAARRMIDARELPEPTRVLTVALRAAVSFAVTAMAIEAVVAR